MWGIIFGVGVLVALVYYIVRQVKDLGVNIFPHNALDNTSGSKNGDS